MYAANQSWSLRGHLIPPLFVGDAICIESDVGGILLETSEVWGRARESFRERHRKSSQNGIVRSLGGNRSGLRN